MKTATAKEIFKKVKEAASRGNAYHIGITTKRRLNEVERLVENEWLNAKCDFKFGIITHEQYETELKKIDCMTKSLSTAYLPATQCYK